METTCTRCHQPVVDGNTFCPSCGLPQLVYSAETAGTPGQPDRWADVARDASMVDWKPAMRAAFLLAIPAGLLSSLSSPVNAFGIFWMAAAAGCAVALYVRGGEGTAWITMGAGARIGLVTGLMAAWLAFAASGGALFVERYMLHSAGQSDEVYKEYMTRSFEAAGQQSFSQLSSGDVAQVKAQWAAMEAMFLSPWGHAGMMTFALAGYSIFLLFFAVGGGALGARLVARMRRPQI